MSFCYEPHVTGSETASKLPKLPQLSQDLNSKSSNSNVHKLNTPQCCFSGLCGTVLSVTQERASVTKVHTGEVPGQGQLLPGWESGQLAWPGSRDPWLGQAPGSRPGSVPT